MLVLLKHKRKKMYAEGLNFYTNGSFGRTKRVNKWRLISTSLNNIYTIA